MRKWRLNALVAGLVGIFALTACKKDPVEPYDFGMRLDIEAPILQRYVDSLVTAGEISQSHLQMDDRGIWFELLDPGDGNYNYRFEMLPDFTKVIHAPKVTIKYSGKLLNGFEFDKNTNPNGDTFALTNVIPAWIWCFLPQTIEGEDIGDYAGLTYAGISKGAKIRFITPSPYAYQDQVRGSIPPNSPLDFTIEVIDIVDQTQ